MQIFQLLEPRLPDGQNMYQLVIQSTNVLNVLYTARKSFDPLFVFWLLPLQCVLGYEYALGESKGRSKKNEKNSLLAEGKVVHVANLKPCKFSLLYILHLDTSV